MASDFRINSSREWPQKPVEDIAQIVLPDRGKIFDKKIDPDFLDEHLNM